MRLRTFGATDKGLVRSSNQDCHYFSSDYGIVIVSDGMGGHRGGEIASQLVVSGLRDAYLATPQILFEDVGPFLEEVLRKINTDILTRSQNDANLKGMGATVNYLQFAGGSLAIGHAGDSRTYLIRAYRTEEGSLRHAMWQLTIDHNVGTFLERGLLRLPGDHPVPSERQKARLMRGMGVTKDLKGDLYSRALREGDVFLTCSDGLHGYVSDRDILNALTEGALADSPARLIALAYKAGAPDNITVVVSTLSDNENPLEPNLQGEAGNPFLVRLPHGEIEGPYTARELLNEWTKGSLPNNAEIAGSLRPWVFLNKPVALFSVYPEFDIAPARQHVALVQPGSIVEDSEEIGDKTRDDNLRRLIRRIIIALFIIAVFIWMGFIIATRIPASGF